jgi:hypothetical protein
MKRLKSWFVEWIIDIIVTNVVVGGRCGLCGKYIPDELFPAYWPWGACKDPCMRRKSTDTQLEEE